MATNVGNLHNVFITWEDAGVARIRRINLRIIQYEITDRRRSDGMNILVRLRRVRCSIHIRTVFVVANVCVFNLITSRHVITTCIAGSLHHVILDMLPTGRNIILLNMCNPSTRPQCGLEYFTMHAGIVVYKLRLRSKPTRIILLFRTVRVHHVLENSSNLVDSIMSGHFISSRTLAPECKATDILIPNSRENEMISVCAYHSRFPT